MPSAVRVLLPLPLPPFSYLVPHDQAAPVLGARVVVPWQQGLRIGIVLEHETVAAGKALELRELLTALGAGPFVLPGHLAFLAKLADRCAAPLGLLLSTLLPTGLNESLEHQVRVHGEADLPGMAAGVWHEAERLAPAKLELYRRQGLLLERVRPVQATARVLVGLRAPDAALSGKPQSAQREALEQLLGYESVPSGAAFAREHGLSESALRALVKKGYAAYQDVPAPPAPLPAYAPEPLTPLDAGLSAAAPAVSVSGGYRLDRLAALLPLLEADVRVGGSALLLMPEGALVQETASRLSSRLPVLVLTGDLSDAQRQRVWQEVLYGSPAVLVGSYLALLAPLSRLARVVVLEAGSGSYKLPAGPRLFVPTAARLLAEAHGVPIAYADALPSPETLHHVPEGERAGLVHPAQRLHLVDLSNSRNWPLSADLVQVLKQVAERGRQAIVLAPRRGFSAALGCSSCGYLAQCPNCDLTLRYHRQPALLRCHQCGYQQPPPALCPSCHSPDIGPMRGAGTEWLMREIGVHISTSAFRMPLYHYDADRRDDLSALLEGEPGVVVATTALLRHPPLPNVSLVAVTLLDTLLSASDFRAEEEVLRLLLNLAELQPGRRPLTLIQTFQPGHPVLAVLRAEDSSSAAAAFMAEVMDRRRRFRYPPYSLLAKVQVSARDAATAEREALWLAGALREAAQAEEDVLGPSPAPIARLRGLYSQQLFARADDAGRLGRLLEPVRAYAGRARVRLDVDPRDVGAFLE